MTPANPVIIYQVRSEDILIAKTNDIIPIIPPIGTVINSKLLEIKKDSK